MKSSSGTLLVMFAFLLASTTSVVLRIRLSTGMIQRLDIDDDTETISSLRARLRENGVISAEDVSFTLKERSYPAVSVSSDSENENVLIKALGISPGEMLSIAKPVTVKERRPAAAFDSDSSNPLANKSSVKKSNKKKPSSIADLEQKRKELLKITRQKGSNGRSVSMTSSAGRILHRMAETGGFAVLLGRAMKPVVAKTAVKKGNSIAAIAKLEAAVKENVEILGVGEIYQFSESSMDGSISNPPENLGGLPAVAIFMQIAKALGLSVVGCCIAMPKGAQVKEGKPVMWSSHHVFAALQIRAASECSVEDAKSFVVISVCKAVSLENDPANSPKKKILKRLKPLTADGISLEAFQLSDQANTLHEKGILPLLRIRSKVSSFSSFATKTNAMKLLASKAMSSGKGDVKAASTDSDNIELEGEALIQNAEVTSLDPFLLAVPLPIKPLRSTTQADSKTVKTDKSVNDDVFEFEHSFPSECEMDSNENTAKVAKLHFARIISDLASPGTKDRMRDPHLLFYMSKILDPTTRDALCRSLRDGTDRFPGLVKVALDMVKINLDGTKSNSNSVGKRSGRFIADDDDDDE